MKKRPPKLPLSKGRIIVGSLVLLLSILFALWAGAGWLLLSLLIADYYFFRFINWSWYKQLENKLLRGIVSLVYDIVVAVLVVFFLSIFFFQNFTIPSSSLEKTLLTGDYLFVDKLAYGPRLPMTPVAIPLAHNQFLGKKSYSEKPLLPYRRLKGYTTVKRGDIVVFNFPAGDTVALKRPNPDYYTLLALYGRDVVWGRPDQFGDIVYRPVDRRDHYVKRCVGMPGDTLAIENNTLLINGFLQPFPKYAQHNYNILVKRPGLSKNILDDLGVSLADRYVRKVSEANADYLKDLFLAFEGDPNELLLYHMPLTNESCHRLNESNQVVSMHIEPDPQGWITYPAGVDTGWSRDNFGPLYIPKRGATIPLTSENLALYRRCITAFEGHTLEVNAEGLVSIDGKPASSYTFEMDYYFMLGDNRHNSADSRSWGLVPEDHIVGRPGLLWLSIDKDKSLFQGRVRWDRLFHIITR